MSIWADVLIQLAADEPRFTVAGLTQRSTCCSVGQAPVDCCAV